MTTEYFVGLPIATQKVFLNDEAEPKKERITQKIFDNFKVDILLKDSSIRTRDAVLARQVSMYFVKKRTALSLKQIGAYFGGRDHSTVIYAIETVNDLYDTNKGFRTRIDELNMVV